MQCNGRRLTGRGYEIGCRDIRELSSKFFTKEARKREEKLETDKKIIEEDRVVWGYGGWKPHSLEILL